jgi:hypothetical protein
MADSSSSSNMMEEDDGYLDSDSSMSDHGIDKPEDGPIDGHDDGDDSDDNVSVVLVIFCVVIYLIGS